MSVYKCNKCGYTSNSKYNLQRHVDRKNPCSYDEDSFKKKHKQFCQYCGEVFQGCKFLIQHQNKCDAQNDDTSILEQISHFKKENAKLREINAAKERSTYIQNNIQTTTVNLNIIIFDDVLEKFEDFIYKKDLNNI